MFNVKIIFEKQRNTYKDNVYDIGCTELERNCDQRKLPVG